MNAAPEDLGPLKNELRRLRRGAGIASKHSVSNIGPALRKIFAIEPGDSESVAHEKAVNELLRASRTLPPNATTAALAALGLHERYESEHLGERIRLLGIDNATSDRTTQRRIDDAFAQLADALARRAVTAGPDQTDGGTEDWENVLIKANLLFTSDAVEVFETREVLSRTTGLDVLHLGFSVPKYGDDEPRNTLQISAIHGGNIERKLAESIARVGFWLKLPEPLNQGQRHEYSIHARIPTGKMPPYYACVLRRRCERFDLNLKFSRLPKLVELVSEEFQIDLDDKSIEFPPVPINVAGEARASFFQLSPGLAYGMRWTW